MDRKKINSLLIIIFVTIIAIIGLVLVKKYNPEEESFFIPCVFNKITGLKCPGCGMTRAMHYLVNGNLKKAVWYNIMIVPGVFILLYSGYRYFKYLTKNEEIVNKPLEVILKIFLVILIIFMVVRNITTIIF